MKKVLFGIIALALLFGCLGTPSFAAYPERNLDGIICWGAGGGTDNTARFITPMAEQVLGKKIILQNKPGAAGAVGTTYVYNKPADGYTLLYGAESANTFKVLGISKIDYDEFEPIMLFLFGVDVICVNPNTPYKTLQEVVEAVKKNPKGVTMATSGTGGIPFVLASLMKKINNVEFNLVGFDGDGPGMTALLGGHVDMMPLSTIVAGVYDLIKTGKLRPLAVIHDKRLPNLPDVPAITEIYPEYKKYLPVGHWYGVFAKKGTPAEAVNTLTAAFTKAVNDPRFDEYVKGLNGIKLGLSGKEARDFINRGRSVISWVLYESGAGKVSPAEFGIPKP